MADDDLIRRGDVLKLIRWGGDVSSIRNAIAALPAQGVRVKPLEWRATLKTGMLRAECPLFNTLHYADDHQDAAQQDAARTARILAALEPASGGVEAEPGKEVMPSDENSIDARPAKSPGVTAGAVDALVKAAEQLRAARNTKSVFTGQPSRGDIEAAMNAVDAALAAYRGDAK